MTVTQVHIEAVELILSSIYARGSQRLCSFMYGPPGSKLWERRLGTELFVEEKDFLKAILYLRQNASAHLSEMAVGDIRSLVTNFIMKNFWLVSSGTLGTRIEHSYASITTPENKVNLAIALGISPLFQMSWSLHLFPLVPIKVEEDFRSDRFFLVSSTNLLTSDLPNEFDARNLRPEEFPPITKWEGVRNRPSSWLGVRSSLFQNAEKRAAVILGAVALTPISRERYLFSGRLVFGGHCTVSDGWSISPGGVAHTPPISSDIVLAERDHTWLAIVSDLLDADDEKSGKKKRALEYFYRAWFLNPSERLPWLFMALESLVGASHGHTKATVSFIRETIENSIDPDRLRLLLHLRGAVVHGAAPDGHESIHYEKYYSNYAADPILDLELVVAKCLRKVIFDNTFSVQKDPHAVIMADLQARNLLTRRTNDTSILRDQD